MNKRIRKKQRKMDAVRLLEKMRMYECAVLIRDGKKRGIVIMEGASITFEECRPEPWAVLYKNARIEGAVVGLEIGV